jgi:hypothetical protein
MTDDLDEIEALMGRFLKAVSFREGERPTYDDLHALFVDGGTLIKTASDVPEITTVHEFIKPRQETVDSGGIATQFIRSPVGWRMSSMAWDDERPGVVLPARYTAS